MKYTGIGFSARFISVEVSCRAARSIVNLR
jgi:hypothetical protein